MTLDIAPTTDDRLAEILSDDALSFVSDLHNRFGATRKQLLQARAERGAPSGFLEETRDDPRGRTWSVRPPRSDYEDRRVEITGPTDRKMIINALNSGAKVLHGRLRGRELADLAQPDRGPRQPDRRDRRHDHLRRLGRQALRAQRPDRDAAGAPARLAPAREAPQIDGEPIAGALVDFGLLRVPQRPARARNATVASTSTCPRWSTTSRRAVERRVRRSPRTSSALPPRHDPRHRADRDAAGRVPDGRDPLRAARSLVRAQRRPLGLHLLDDQDASATTRTSSCPTATTSR